MSTTDPKYGVEEIMELLDVFNVSPVTAAKIRCLLLEDPNGPDGGVFFRYYNPRSKTAELEKRFAAHVGVKHVLAVNSGTSALIAALVAAGVGPGDEVIVPAYTFFATASAVVVAKAIPVIAEIDETLSMCPAAAERLITPRTKAIMPVHMLGHPARMDALCALAKKHNLVVIEDAAQACGGSFQGRYLGTWGDFGCISFDAYKIMGTGEGGALLTNDDFYYTRAQSYHDTAACWRPDRYGRERMSGELFCGENYRMNELAAAVGLAQLRRLDWTIARMRERYHQIKNSLSLPPGIKWLAPADENGVCGSNLAMLFDDEDYAVRAQKARLVGGNALKDTTGVRDWHMAWNWEHILEEKTATEEGCPFRCPFVKERPQYTVDSWPQTRAIMRRLGVIGISPRMTEQDAEAIVERLQKGLATC